MDQAKSTENSQKPAGMEQCTTARETWNVRNSYPMNDLKRLLHEARLGQAHLGLAGKPQKVYIPPMVWRALAQNDQVVYNHPQLLDDSRPVYVDGVELLRESHPMWPDRHVVVTGPWKDGGESRYVLRNVLPGPDGLPEHFAPSVRMPHTPIPVPQKHEAPPEPPAMSFSGGQMTVNQQTAPAKAPVAQQSSRGKK